MAAPTLSPVTPPATPERRGLGASPTAVRLTVGIAVALLALVVWAYVGGPSTGGGAGVVPTGGGTASESPTGSAGVSPGATPGAAGGTSAQATVPPVDTPGLPAGASMFAPQNFWRTPVTNAPVNPNSAAIVGNLAHQVASAYGGVAALNAHQYNAAFYTVNESMPRQDVIWDDCQHKGAEPAGLAEQFAQVPVPADAVPSPGTDSTLTIYSPSLDKIWDLWVAHKKADGWHACWGGRMDDVSTRLAPYFPNGFGASASGLAHFAGAVSIADLQAGHIDHVMSLNVIYAAPWNHFSWPAQRSDGGNDGGGASAVPEGLHLRLDPSVDVGSLHLNPIATMIAKAAQTYGFVVTDRASGVAVIAESGAGIRARTGADPWDQLLGGTPDYAVLKDFPWNKLQALPENYGKPGG
jgi:hypothetical protein